MSSSFSPLFHPSWGIKSRLTPNHRLIHSLPYWPLIHPEYIVQFKQYPKVQGELFVWSARLSSSLDPVLRAHPPDGSTYYTSSGADVFLSCPFNPSIISLIFSFCLPSNWANRICGLTHWHTCRPLLMYNKFSAVYRVVRACSSYPKRH